MKAMILAAGLGTRLRPLTDSVPKPLIEVAGQPMITFPLGLVRDAGIAEVVINLHHLSKQVREQLGDGRTYGVRIVYSEEDPILDTGGAIAAAREFLDGDTFVVLNADTFIDLHLQDVIDFHRAHRATATMVLRPDPDAVRRDRIRIDAAQRIVRIFDQPVCGASPASEAGHAGISRAEELPTPFMYTGVMVLEPRAFTYMPPGVYSITRDVYPRLLAAGELLYGYIHYGYWRVLDTLGDLAAGRREILERLRNR
jgi:NDP-sugar pyrophosphorylase family protein